MLMIYLMAIWTLDLLPYTVEDAINTTRRLPPKPGHNYGTVANQYQTSGRRFNSTILSTSTTTPSPTPADDVTLNLIPGSTTLSYSASKWQHGDSAATTPASFTKHRKVRVKKKGTIRKLKPEHWTRANNSKFITRSNRDLLPKSNMQVLQFYAHPLNTIELKGQPLPTFVDGGLDEAVRELPVLMNPAHGPTAISHSQVYMAPSTYANSVAYKAIPEEYVHPFKPLTYNSGLERPAALSAVPVLDPYNVYKRNPKPKALPLMPVQPAQKFVATIRSVTPPMPIVPPVSVTRVYKYTDDPSPAFKLPFLENEDPIDENLPILSAALDDRLNDRVASLSIKNYMTPPKLGQPIVYGSGPRATAALPDVYRNEYHILSKYNVQTHPPTGLPHSFEEDVSGRDKENYSEEEVKKALKYIQRLKKHKPSMSRGRSTFKSSQQFRKLKGKNKDENLGEDADEEDMESELISGGKKKGETEHDPFHISDDDDDENDDTLQVKSFTEGADKNQEESRTKTVKAVVGRAPRTPEVPSVDNKIDEDEPAESPKLGVDNDGDDRVEFQMHGLGGAESYKFGYDTGKGENRQFRYEERDANGKVKGHFGYYDRDGKLQLFNYEADPEHGYHLEKAADH